jgi:uncharacterized ion transporter superfamily protein YfcC
MYVQRITGARSRNHCCRGKAISITYCECVSVAFVIRHAKRMRRVVLSSVVCLALLYFSTLSHKRHDFQKKFIEHKMCVLIFSTTFVWNISHSEKNCARYHKYTFSCKVPVIGHTLMKLEFSWQFFKTLKYQISRKSVLWQTSCSMKTDGQTRLS